MNTKLIELTDGLQVVVTVNKDALQQIAACTANRIDRALDGVGDMLKISPVAATIFLPNSLA